jgi:hypothetical protein
MHTKTEDKECKADRLAGSDDGGGWQEEPPADPARARRLRAACACILGNETAERLTYYGLSTNLSLYAKQLLGYPAARATALLQAWKATVYVTPLLGAYLGDSHFGRFTVILAFSALYLAGLCGVTGVNASPALRPRFNAPPGGGYAATRGAFWVFMYLIALGAWTGLGRGGGRAEEGGGCFFAVPARIAHTKREQTQTVQTKRLRRHQGVRQQLRRRPVPRRLAARARVARELLQLVLLRDQPRLALRGARRRARPGGPRLWCVPRAGARPLPSLAFFRPAPLAPPCPTP